MSEWDDELKNKAINAYKERDPTPETSAEIVAEIAEEMGKSANGVRMILSKAGVYIKKSAEASKSTATKSATGGTRVDKAKAIEGLKTAIQDKGLEVDEDIVSKLTGKAALYFTSLIN